MAIGDKAFNLDLQKQILPRRWFPSSNLSNSTTATPILDGLLSGSAQMFAAAYAQWQYGDNQARIATATDINLDLISDDFFAGMLPRNTGEKDDLFLKRIQKELLRPRGTRSAISKLIFDWTGNTPTIIEPRLVSDTGAYSTGVTEPYAVALDFGAQSILPNNMTFVRETSSTIQPVAAYTTQEHANEITKYINEQVVGESRDEITFSTFWNEVCVKIKDTCAEEDSEKYVVECKRSNHSWSGGRGYWDLTVTSGERATQTNRHTSTIISVHFSDGVIYSTHVNDSFELSTLSTWFKALQFRKTKITDIAEETASIPEGY